MTSRYRLILTIPGRSKKTYGEWYQTKAEALEEKNRLNTFLPSLRLQIQKERINRATWYLLLFNIIQTPTL